MAAVQLSGVWGINLSGRFGPYQDSNGNLWIFGGTGTAGNNRAWKSSDGGVTWGTYYNAAGLFGDLEDVIFDAAGDKAYLLRLSSGQLYIYPFTLSTHTYGSEIYSSGSRPTVGTDVNNKSPAFLTRRSTGEFVVFYQGPTHSSMGSSYRSVYYARCSAAGVWSAGVEVDAGGAVNYDCKEACLGASNRVHMLYTHSSLNLLHRSLDSTNTFAGPDTLGGSLPTAYCYSIYYDATLGKVVANESGTVYRGTSSATPGWATDTGLGFSGNVSTACTVAFLYEPTDAKLYAFYRDASSDDVYQNSAPDSGTTWGTPAQQDVCTAVNGISVGLITDAIGVVFNDSGVYFDKLVLSSPVPPVTANEEFFALL